MKGDKRDPSSSLRRSSERSDTHWNIGGRTAGDFHGAPTIATRMSRCRNSSVRAFYDPHGCLAGTYEGEAPLASGEQRCPNPSARGSSGFLW